MARPRTKLDSRLLKKVRKWLLTDEKPLSFVLKEIGMTVKAWDALVKTDTALQDRGCDGGSLWWFLRNGDTHDVNTFLGAKR
ncbi:hypothetical protein So717_17330 [Roseobacter cerasinus]|uniref:Uncharacterized protein n=1 Tax=Roseobacter cerasinus TaxID=2602289 RepID=A0A640VRC2_9RHOB|nr:hypothetical protein [Roseobacter cerasinus]GFE49980.1 hypothetical protein So717_17330 [Roseobacter cerasinus]